MGSLYADQHHKFHSLISPKKTLQDLNIPPRKLLSRRTDATSDYFSPSAEAAATALIHKFLPCNVDSSSSSGGGGDGSDADADDDPYSSDEFRMYEFKVRKCTRSRSHDWTDCPFSHPGEKARRRDPRRFHYSGTVCPEYRRSGGCSREDDCEFAHGVFECWLHPSRYRTEACKDGKNCKRKVCFFAHSPRELRVLPVEEDGEREHNNCSQRCHNGKLHQHSSHCCRYCFSLSPTSTLLGLSNFSPPMSPTLSSPPMSPMKPVGPRGLSGFSRYSDRMSACVGKGLSYEDMVIADVLGSLEGMSINEALTPNKGGCGGGGGGGRGLWVDVNGFDTTTGVAGVTDDYLNHQQHHQQMQFSLSPSTPINQSGFSRNLFSTSAANYDSSVAGYFINKNCVDESPSPDLGWVNDLLM